MQQQRLDMSGLGGKAGQVWPRLVPVVKASGTDEMRIDLGEFTIPPAANRPWLVDRQVGPVEFVDEIVNGFWEASAVIQKPGGTVDRMLSLFADVEVRHIPRPTARYGLFLREGWHPDYLRDALAGDRLLDKLWAEAEVKAELAALVSSEQADLRIGDIPFFTTRPGSRSVWNSCDERIDDYFEESALSVARRRLAGVTTDERRHQASLIRQAVLSVKGEAATRINESPSPSGGPASRAELLEAARTIGYHRRDKAIFGADDACWIGPVMQKSDHWEWRLAPLSTGLYEGIGGIALLFAQLAQMTGLSEFDDMATRAVRPIRQHITDQYPVGAISVGAFSGSASLAYVLSVVAGLRGDRQLVDRMGSGPRSARGIWWPRWWSGVTVMSLASGHQRRGHDDSEAPRIFVGTSSQRIDGGVQPAGAAYRHPGDAHVAFVSHFREDALGVEQRDYIAGADGQ